MLPEPKERQEQLAHLQLVLLAWLEPLPRKRSLPPQALTRLVQTPGLGQPALLELLPLVLQHLERQESLHQA